MSIEIEYEKKLEDLRFQILNIPKKDRIPLKTEFKNIQTEFKMMCNHPYVFICEHRVICVCCGKKEYGIFKVLKNKNSEEVSYEEFIKTNNKFEKFRPS
jgi:hypothetical protein